MSELCENFLTACEHRHSYYALSNSSPLTPAELESLAQRALLCAPSAYNSQSARLVLLLGENHAALWSIVKETLRARVPAEKFARTENKINSSFASGYGSFLFFEDDEAVDGLKAQFPSYAENFTPWSLQSSGMLQYLVWTALEAAGLGASLQHYNPLIDAEVKRRWELPESWRLVSQMPFGAPLSTPGDKNHEALETRFRFFE